MRLEEIADIKFTFPEKASEGKDNTAYWVTATCLQANNVIDCERQDINYNISDDLLLREGDIVIKRISPQFVNVIGETDVDLYAGTNLVIINAKPGYSAKYIAYILEKNINKLHQKTAGAVMPAISRKVIADLNIKSPQGYDKQVAIGELWWLQKEKKKYQEQLNEKETLRIKYLLNIVK